MWPVVKILDGTENVLDLRESIIQQICSTQLLRCSQESWPHLPTDTANWRAHCSIGSSSLLCFILIAVFCNKLIHKLFLRLASLGPGEHWQCGGVLKSSPHPAESIQSSLSSGQEQAGLCSLQPSKHRLLAEKAFYGDVKPEDYGEQSPGNHRGSQHWLQQRD